MDMSAMADRTDEFRNQLVLELKQLAMVVAELGMALITAEKILPRV